MFAVRFEVRRSGFDVRPSGHRPSAIRIEVLAVASTPTNLNTNREARTVKSERQYA
jgi:hypothetical protein